MLGLVTYPKLICWGLGAQMLGLEVQMLALGSYEERWLSWCHMHDLSHCCIALHKGCTNKLCWMLLSNYCIDLCN